MGAFFRNPATLRLVGLDAVDASLAGVLDSVRGLSAGAVADYIPELAKVDPDGLGLAMTSVAGHCYAAGDATVTFTMQSISKPFVYALALADLGPEAVHEHVGFEPSGEPFNAISLDDRGRPANPMINAGAIVATSLIAADSPAARVERIRAMLSAFAGRELTIDDEVYRSEAATGDRNRALAYLTTSSGVLVGDPVEAVDAYFRTCAVTVDVRDLAVMGATLANDGVNPVTGRAVVDSHIARDVLSLMASCGMYDASGAWMLRVGMPAKSGVGGGIVAVKPGQFGIGTFSPRLDDAGNSARGVAVLELLSHEYGLHLLQHPAAPASPIERIDDDASGTVVVVRGDVDFTDAEQIAFTLAQRSGAATLTVDLSNVTRLTPVASRLLRRLATENPHISVVDSSDLLGMTTGDM